MSNCNLAIVLLTVIYSLLCLSSTNGQPQIQVSTTNNAPLPLSRPYQHNQSLTGDGTFDLFWSINETSQEFFMAMSAQTTGWVAIGFRTFFSTTTPTEVGMIRSDIIIGWRDSLGNAFVEDTYAVSNSRPLLDIQL